MDKKSIGIGIGQIAVIVLVWMLNPNAMVEHIDRLLVVFEVGCVAGGTAPSIFSFTKSTNMRAWAIALELLYICMFTVLFIVVLCNIAI